MFIQNCVRMLTLLSVFGVCFLQAANQNKQYYTEISDLFTDQSISATPQQNEDVLSQMRGQGKGGQESDAQLYPININVEPPNVELPGPVSSDARSGGTTISKDIFDDTASKQEQMPKNASTPAVPSYGAGKDDAISETVKKGKQFFRMGFGESIFEITNRLRIESLYGVNLRFLNNKNNEEDPELDKIAFPGRHTYDVWFFYTYGNVSRGYDIVKFRMGLRNRAIWGNETVNLPTSQSEIKSGDAIIGNHKHAITRNVFWARELWFEATLNDVFGWKTPHRHTFTAGLFSFTLGRGIALGDAFATDNDFLGYFGANAIDQFAPGVKLSGEFIAPQALNYDLYWGIIDNSASSFDEVNQEINSQRFGFLHRPQRGFGIFDFIFAGRLMWRPYDESGKRAYLEPYALYSVDGEQKIKSVGDARQKLGTFGLAVEFEYGNFEGGFDTAFNVGHQDVFGWDKNVIQKENRDGFDVQVFSHVSTEKPEVGQKIKKALVTAANKATVVAGPRDQKFNGEQIPPLKDSQEPLFNSLNRFNNAYRNDLRGKMFVCDVAYRLPCTMKIAATAGVATGDDDPNKDLQSHGDSAIDRVFKGFVGEQEIYSGKRVRSLFVMSGQGRIPRLLSIPALDSVDNEPTQVERFTNLILAGTGFQAKPQILSTTYDFQTNVLAFWVDHTPRIFRERGKIIGEKDLVEPFTRYANNTGRFLGIEWNFIVEAEIIKDLTFIFNGALFFPGSFFTSLKNQKGITKAQRNFLKTQAEQNEGAKVTKVPLIGNDLGYFINCAFEYKF